MSFVIFQRSMLHFLSQMLQTKHAIFASSSSDDFHYYDEKIRVSMEGTTKTWRRHVIGKW